MNFGGSPLIFWIIFMSLVILLFFFLYVRPKKINKRLNAGVKSEVVTSQTFEQARHVTEEQIIGTIDAFKQRRGGQDFLLLCFTPSRVVVAKTGHFNSLAWAFLLGLGNLFLFPLARRRARARAEEVGRLPVGGILKADNANFQIAYEDITRVEMKRPSAIIGWPMSIATSTTEHVFGIVRKNKFEVQSKLIQSVLGDKLNIS